MQAIVRLGAESQQRPALPQIKTREHGREKHVQRRVQLTRHPRGKLEQAASQERRA